MLNPYAKIRALEHELEHAQLARVKAEDDSRLYHAQLVEARESESKAWQTLNAKSEKTEDWMAALLRQPPIHSTAAFEPKPAPPPTRRPVSHGAMLENQQLEQYEKDLGIPRDPIN